MLKLDRVSFCYLQLKTLHITYATWQSSFPDPEQVTSFPMFHFLWNEHHVNRIVVKMTRCMYGKPLRSDDVQGCF